MKTKSKKMSNLSRMRWGDNLVCRVKEGKAVCKFNDVSFVGLGKTNLEALDNVFVRILKNLNELAKLPE